MAALRWIRRCVRALAEQGLGRRLREARIDWGPLASSAVDRVVELAMDSPHEVVLWRNDDTFRPGAAAPGAWEIREKGSILDQRLSEWIERAISEAEAEEIVSLDDWLAAEARQQLLGRGAHEPSACDLVPRLARPVRRRKPRKRP